MKKFYLLATIALTFNTVTAQIEDKYKNGKPRFRVVSKFQITSLDEKGIEIGLGILTPNKSGDTLQFELKWIEENMVTIKGAINLLNKNLFNSETFIKSMLDFDKKTAGEFDSWAWVNYTAFGKHSGNIRKQMSCKGYIYYVTEYSQDGKMYKYHMSKGVLEGKYQIFNSIGILIYQTNIVNGKRETPEIDYSIGSTTFYENSSQLKSQTLNSTVGDTTSITMEFFNSGKICSITKVIKETDNSNPKKINALYYPNGLMKKRTITDLKTGDEESWVYPENESK